MKKFSFLIILVLFVWSGNLSFALPTEDARTFETGRNLFLSKQYKAAYDLLFTVFENHPEDLELNFYLGRAAFETGQYEMAIMAYERILIASPFENRVKLELARSFHAIGAGNTARRYCYDVLATKPPEPVKKNIEKFLTIIDQSEKKHFLHGQISLGVDWNNNIWVTPAAGNIKTVIGDIQLSGPSSKKTQDWAVTETANIEHTYRFLPSPHNWKTDILLYNGIYHETSALDLRYISGTTGPEWIKGKSRYGTKAFLEQVELGNEKYQDGFGFKAFMDYAFNPSCLIRNEGAVKVKNYPDNSQRDASNYSWLFNLRFPIKTSWCGIRLKAEIENASNDEYSYKRVSPGLSVSKNFMFNTTGSARYEYELTQYDEPGTLFSEKRKDQQHRLGINLERPLWQSSEKQQNINLDLNYQHIWAFSNIDLYEYTQDLFQVSIIYNF